MAIEVVEEVGSFTLANPTRKYDRIVGQRKSMNGSPKVDIRGFNADQFTAAGLWLSPQDLPALIELAVKLANAEGIKIPVSLLKIARAA